MTSASTSPERYRAPELPNDEKVTPSFVRDELLKCFQSANHEFMTAMNQKPTPSDSEIQQQIKQFVSGAFQSCGSSIENPTKEGIIAAIEECKKSAQKMMGENGASIINHHYEEMMKILRKLK